MPASLYDQLLSPWLYTFRRYQRQWSKRAANQSWIAILCYHRIVASKSDNQGLYGVEQGLPAATFEAQMRFMRRHFMPIRAAEVPQYQSLPGCYFAVTFDDGYVDNFTVAAPILRQLGLSATFFVTRHIDTKIDSQTPSNPENLFWWEQLAQMIRLTTLSELFIDVIFRDWIDYQLCPLNLVLSTHANKLKSFHALSNAFMNTPWRELEPRLDLLAHALQVNRASLQRQLPLMNKHQLQQGFDIGGHTANHVHLGLANPSERQSEIVDATKTLNLILQKPVECFAYPYGQPRHCTGEARADVIRSGYQVAFTTSKRLVTAEDDIYTLPRIRLNHSYGFACGYTVEQTFKATIEFQNRNKVSSESGALDSNNRA